MWFVRLKHSNVYLLSQLELSNNVNSEKIKDNDYFLPCPFCGDTELEIIESQFEDTEDGDGLTVYCDCGAQGPAARTEDEAILKWNSRFKS